MPLEKQVCSLELAKKLKELGVKQESLYVWVEKFPIFDERDRLVTFQEYQYRLATIPLSDKAKGLIKTFSAFTVAELGDMLPGNINGEPILCQWGLMHNVHYIGIPQLHQEEANTEADARAKMLIYLIENNLIQL